MINSQRNAILNRSIFDLLKTELSKSIEKEK